MKSLFSICSLRVKSTELPLLIFNQLWSEIVTYLGWIYHSNNRSLIESLLSLLFNYLLNRVNWLVIGSGNHLECSWVISILPILNSLSFLLSAFRDPRHGFLSEYNAHVLDGTQQTLFPLSFRFILWYNERSRDFILSFLHTI